jgi:regulator of cell morphogenesis and NO signaling
MNVAETEDQDSSNKKVGEYVAEDYRIAKVFEKFGIDFCCGGNVALIAACQEKRIDPVTLQLEIAAVKSEPIERSQNYAVWELPFLADYIVTVHHSYIKENAGQIDAYSRKIAEVHGANHPEVREIAAIFDKIAIDLTAHLREEEEVFFPACKRADAARKGGFAPDPQDTEAIRADLVKLRREHDEVGAAVHSIRHLAKDYAIPGDACNTFMVTYQKLSEFEDDLHKHVHLENNILFSKAEQLM